MGWSLSSDSLGSRRGPGNCNLRQPTSISSPSPHRVSRSYSMALTSNPRLPFPTSLSAHRLGPHTPHRGQKPRQIPISAMYPTPPGNPSGKSPSPFVQAVQQNIGNQREAHGISRTATATPSATLSLLLLTKIKRLRAAVAGTRCFR